MTQRLSRRTRIKLSLYMVQQPRLYFLANLPIEG